MKIGESNWKGVSQREFVSLCLSVLTLIFSQRRKISFLIPYFLPVIRQAIFE